MKTRRPGKAVAKIAGTILAKLDGRRGEVWFDSGGLSIGRICTVEELRAVCASALTQAENREKGKRS